MSLKIYNAWHNTVGNGIAMVSLLKAQHVLFFMWSRWPKTRNNWRNTSNFSRITYVNRKRKWVVFLCTFSWRLFKWIDEVPSWQATPINLVWAVASWPLYFCYRGQTHDWPLPSLYQLHPDISPASPSKYHLLGDHPRHLYPHWGETTKSVIWLLALVAH